MNANNLQVLFTSIPGRYARALFVAGKKADCLDEILEDFDKIASLCNGNRQAKKMLAGNFLNKKELDKSWISIGKSLSLCRIFLSFIGQVSLNKRFAVIGKIEHIYRLALENHRKQRGVTVLSCVELSAKQKKSAESIVAKVVGNGAIISYSIDKEILGGVKIIAEGLVIDASLASQAKQMSQYLLGTPLE
jgi:F-type H+-transporting ATPase subunit delta